ncbi:DUF1302 family protein [Agrilutibacter solisilvae]|uniref:Porin n=1 Tax=Agrilutibacter solisilvae TaxID=2763317 RepID=A0A974XZA3_9GAMM|nr:DUF1302 family protein [Lysobacter solisilvae]QSX77643.1 hypothetical protein I8J32_012940 [Lysobacter solisilvae]
MRLMAPLGIVAALASPAAAFAADLSGSLRLSYFSSSRDLDDVRGVQALTGEIEWKQDIGPAHRLEVKGRSTLFGHGSLARTRTHWSSALWHARFEHADLRLGQQKIRWGKADGINPTDFFTPVDYTTVLPLEDDRYLSVPAARLDLHLSDVDSLSMVVGDGFTPSRIPWPRPSPVTVRDDEPDAGQLGARWTHTGERQDWSLSAFRGHSTLPLLHAQEPGSPGETDPDFVRHYARVQGFGVDLARSVGAFGFRAELAYVVPRGYNARQSIRSNWHLVAGVDRSFPAWNFNVQAVVRHTPDFEPIDGNLPDAVRFAALQNGLIHGQQARWVHGMTARVAADWRNDTLQTELLAVAQFSPDNYLLRPLVTYAWSDRVKLRAGAEYYRGPADTYFGALERNRTAFVEWQLFY